MRELCSLKGARMALSLRDVRCDPIANRALNELMHHYTVAQEKSRLVLTKKTGDMKLFLNDLDDLHQWDFIRNQQMVKQIERLRVLLTTTNQHRESWKVRALIFVRLTSTSSRLVPSPSYLWFAMTPRVRPNKWSRTP
jgi:hypothetical protein